MEEQKNDLVKSEASLNDLQVVPEAKEKAKEKETEVTKELEIEHSAVVDVALPTTNLPEEMMLEWINVGYKIKQKAKTEKNAKDQKGSKEGEEKKPESEKQTEENIDQIEKNEEQDNQETKNQKPDPKDLKKYEDHYILQHLNGYAKCCEMLAIIGASGAGKSTFLDVLAGRKSKANVDGKVLISGKSTSSKALKRISSYVMQDDSLWGNLTVRENISYTADLMLPRNEFTHSDKKKRVDQVIEDMGLSRVQNSKIGAPLIRGISGGERRRASIASQLVTAPKILFLDEPTSGLDSAASFYVMKAVKDLAIKYKMIVVATIHQPSPETFELFDRLLVLGAGRTIYFGELKGCTDYFAKIGYPIPLHTNPADFILKTTNIDFFEDKEEAKRHIGKLADNWKDSEIKEGDEMTDLTDLEKVEVQKHPNSFLYQTGVLTNRSVLNALRNPVMYWIRLAMYIAMALLVGSAWYKIGTFQDSVQDRFSVLFFSIAFLSFMSVSGIPAFLEERFIFIREYTNGYYGVGPYVLSNTFVLLPFLFVIAIVYSGIMYGMVGLRSGAGPFFLFVTYLWLALIVAETMTILIASAFPVFVAALALTAFANGLFMVVQGYFIRKSNIPGYWIWAHYIDYQKYSFEGMAFNDFSGLTFQCQQNGDECFCTFPRSDPSKCEFTGEDVLTYYDYENVKPWLWCLALVIMFFVFRIGFYLLLKFRNYKQ